MSLTEAQLIARQRIVTASKLPAIIGVSPFKTRDQILHEVTSNATRGQMLPHQERGHLLEPIVGEWLCRELSRDLGRPLRVVKGQEFLVKNSVFAPSLLVEDTLVHKLEPRFAATPDFYMCDAESEYPRPRRFTEIKTSSERKGWFPDQVPAYIYAQCQWQLYVLRSWMPVIEYMDVGALVCSNFIRRRVIYDHGFVLTAAKAAYRYLQEMDAYLDTGTVHPLPSQSAAILETIEDATAVESELLERRANLLEEKRGIEQTLDSVNQRLLCSITPTRSVAHQGRIFRPVVVKPRVDQGALVGLLKEHLRGHGVHDSVLNALDDACRNPEGGYSYISSTRQRDERR